MARSEPAIKAPQVLLVEDNQGDVLLTQIAWRSTPFDRYGDLHVVRDGQDAVDFLWQRGKYADAPRPHIVMLDLNLPKLSGSEVLKRVKADTSLRRIPVIILTSSRAEADLLSTHDLHCNAYMTKPVEKVDLVSKIRSLHNFWIQNAKVPQR